MRIITKTRKFLEIMGADLDIGCQIMEKLRELYGC